MAQNADGSAHLTYYVRAQQLSFVWDGVSGRVEVSWGGYGEPVVDSFAVPEGLAGLRPPQLFRGFALACEGYAAQLLEALTPA